MKKGIVFINSNSGTLGENPSARLQESDLRLPMTSSDAPLLCLVGVITLYTGKIPSTGSKIYLNWFFQKWPGVSRFSRSQAKKLRNGLDKNDSNNGNEHVGIQLVCKKVITFLLSVLTSDWLKQQKLSKLHKSSIIFILTFQPSSIFHLVSV